MRARSLAALALFASFGAAAAVVFGGSAAADNTTTSACPAYNPPNTLVLVAGTPQSAKLGAAFDANLQVSLANTNGCPLTSSLAGVAVTFTAPSSGPSGTFSSSGANAVLVGTNASGDASAPLFTANMLAGGYQAVASSEYGSVGFSLVNTASGVASTIGPVTSSESATIGSRYAQPLQATVRDANGNPVEGATVTFSLGSSAGGTGTSPGASFDGGGTQASETTDATGTATSPLFTADETSGTFTASASTAGVVEPAGFALVNVAGSPPAIEAVAPKQAAVVGAVYAKPLRVKVKDHDGKPVQDASVTFTLGSGGAGGAAATAGASFVDGSTQATETTDASGVATSPRFVANAVAGGYTATATTAGTSAAASFSLDNVAGKGSVVRVAGPAKRSAVVGHRYSRPLQVKVVGANGKPLQGASVTFTLGSSGAGGATSTAGGSFVVGGSQATATTDASGVATSPRVIANTVAGVFTATATTSGSAEPALFDLHNSAARVRTIAAGVAASESTPVGTQFPVRLAVTVDDAHGNPVPGVVVRFTAPAHGPSGRFAGKRHIVTTRTDTSGVAVAPTFVADRTQGGYIVRASAAGHAAAFALVNEPAR
jgi:adhesin/invasin